MPDDSRADIRATPLYQAAPNGHRQVVETLLQGAADVNARAVGGFTPLIAAGASGRTEILRLLVAKGANVNAANDDRFTALHWASANNHIETIGTLLDLGPDPSASRWSVGGYAADEAFVRGHVNASSRIINRDGKYRN